jgi:hypothetical protein
MQQTIRPNPTEVRYSATKPVASNRLAPQIPIETVTLITRTTSITVCSIVLFVSSIATFLLVLTDAPLVSPLTKAVSPSLIYLSVAYTLLCGIGYWKMKRWAVLLYGVELALRVFAGLPTSYVAVPTMIVAIGFINFDEMTWL